MRTIKKAFFYATIPEFVDFCEDAIFEMQHAETMMISEESGATAEVGSGHKLSDKNAHLLRLKGVRAGDGIGWNIFGGMNPVVQSLRDGAAQCDESRREEG